MLYRGRAYTISVMLWSLCMLNTNVHFKCDYDYANLPQSRRLNTLRLALHTYIMLGMSDKAYRMTILLAREARRINER